MAVIRLMLPETFEQAFSDAAFPMTGTPCIPIAYMSDEVDTESLKAALEWYVEESAALEVSINEIGRRFGEDEDSVFVDFESAQRPQSALSFIFWLYDIEASINTRLRAEICTIGKGNSVPPVSFHETALTLKNLSVVVGEQETLYDLSVKHQGVQELTTTGTNMLVTESQQNVKGRIVVEMKIETQFKGAYPEIKLPEDIEAGTDEVFVTLPVGAFNAESLNGHTYRKTAMQDMLDQINGRRPESNWGHLSEYEAGLRYNNPPVRWLAATEQDGVIFAKCRALTEEARTYYKRAKMDNARVGTSLFAWAEVEGTDVIHLDLITIDLADPARVGVPITAAKPVVVTSEMHKPEGEQDMLEEKKLRELLKLGDEDSIETAVEAAIAVQAESASKVTELQARAAELETQNGDLHKTNAELMSLALTHMLESAVKIVENRPLIRDLIAGVDDANLVKLNTLDDLKSAVRDVLSRESVKQANREMLAALTGDPQSRPTDGAASNGARHFNIPKGDK